MTAEASECNGRCEVSKVEFEGKGGDLKESGGCDGIACRDGEEIGGSFVIVNGDSDDQLDRDLDLDGKIDPLLNASSSVGEEVVGDRGVSNEKRENGELTLENVHEIQKDDVVSIIGVEENGGERELCEKEENARLRATNGDGENGENVELCSGIDAEGTTAVEGTANGREETKTAVEVEGKQEPEALVTETSAAEIEQEKEAEVVVTDTDQPEELGSAIEVEAEQNAETLIVEAEEKDSQTESGSAVKVEGGMEPEVVVTETEHREELGSAAEVEKEKEAEVDKELGSSVEVEEKQGAEILVVGAEETQEGDNQTESESDVKVEEEREPEDAVAETDHQVELGSAVEVEDMNPQTSVTETDCSEELDSDARVEEKQEPEFVLTETDDNGVAESVEVEERWKPEAAVEETDRLVELETAVEVELKKETEAVVEETENLAELESAVEVELKQEPEAVVEETDKLEELESAVELELKPEPETVVEETDKLAELESAVEEELKQEPETVVEESDKVEAEEKQEPEAVVEETDSLVKLESAVEVESKQEPETVVAEAEKVEAEENQEPEVVVEETDKLAELKSAIEELKQEPETVVEESDKVEAEENQEPEVVVEETDSLVELESAVEVESKQEPETVVAEAEKVEAEENQEPEVVVTETTASECLPFENEEAVTPNAAADAPIDEPSAQNENGTIENDEANVVCDVNGGIDSTAEISGDSLEDESKGEARFIPLESSESPIVCHVAEIEMVNEVACSIDDKNVELEVSNGSASNGETVPSEPKADNSIEDDEPRTSDPVSAMNLEPQTAELCPNNDIELETKACVEVNETDKNVTSHHTGGTKLESESGNESAEGGECMASSIEEDQSTNKDDDEEPAHEQAEAAEVIQAPPEPHVVKRQQVFIVKVPRFTDDELQKKIQLAQSLVDEKTQSRDSIKDAIQKKKVVCNQYEKDLEAAKAEERAARAAVSAKRQEIDTVQAMISKMKNATTIADIDDKIRNMVHRQQHETISLKQEKQYIHEINQLKHLREQLSAKRAPQEQIDEALGQRDEIESRFKTFKKELDSLRAIVSQAESRTKIAWKRYDDEHQLLQNLQEQYKVAADIRQEAYGHFLKLRKQSNEKIKHFKMYKADQQAAMNYIFSGDNEGLRSYCSRQIERIMELWNNNQEFREQYIKSNYNSTLRRLGTLDGRSLGPGEEAPILRSYVDKRSNIVSLPSSNIETPAPTLALEVKESSGEPLATEQVARTNQSSKLKSSTKPTSREGIMATISTSEELKEEEKENKLTKEEEELARKAEELARKEEEFRKEKAAAELKERLRLEQRAKAREAEERKKRRVEKAQAKAEYRAQKEAELKEKKKAKKDNKKAGTADTPNGGVEGESAPVTDTVPPETSQESETKVTTASMKRSARTAAAVKQYNRVQPLPLPLRNKGKRKMATWMWVLLTTLLVLILFFAGNYVSFSKFSLSDFGF